MEAERPAAPNWRSRAFRTARQIGPARLIACALILALALIVARQGWHLPLTVDAERALYDWRTERAAPRVAQDDRMVMIVYTDETLEAVAKRSPLDRQMLADALRAIDAMNPRAIGIDILFDQPQEEDDALIETLRTLKTPTYLAFASNATNPDYMRVWQEEFLTSFINRAAPGPVKPTSILLRPDGDNVIRRWPDQPASLPPLFANALAPGHEAFREYRGAIRFAQPKSPEYPVISSLPIDLFAGDLAPAMRAQVEGRYVLIGGDIQDLDDYQTPLTRQTGMFMKGLEVHARLLAQMLDGTMPRAIPGWVLWIMALAVVGAGAMTSLMEMRGLKLAVVFVGQLAFFVALPFYLATTSVDTLDLPAFGWGAGWILAFLAAGSAARAVGSEQKRFAQSALGKYLPADIAAQILKDPELLALRGEKKQIYALFTDLEGFTKLSHAITPEQLSALLNRYLDVMSDTVLQHGGTIDKFVGDAVVAFWGAPIERPDDADRACRAAVAMFEAGEAFARSAGPDLPKIGCTRVGLHRGEAVVGNFGGEGRIQYTALGDGMNTAARLESANKYLKTTALVSDEAKRESSLDIFRPMGRIVLSGRATPVAVWEPVPAMDADLRDALNALWLRFDGGDQAALTELENLANGHPEDAALANFVYRVREAGPGGHYVLGSK